MTDSTQDNPGIVVPPPLIYAAALATGLLVHRFFPVKVFPRAGARLLGSLFTAIAGALVISGMREMRRAGATVNTTQPAAALVTSGPFRLTRNPLYLALTFLYAGIALFVNSLWAIIPLPGVLAVMRYGVIAREESYLERRFGQQYLSYKARVRRWI